LIRSPYNTRSFDRSIFFSRGLRADQNQSFNNGTAQPISCSSRSVENFSAIVVSITRLACLRCTSYRTICATAREVLQRFDFSGKGPVPQNPCMPKYLRINGLVFGKIAKRVFFHRIGKVATLSSDVSLDCKGRVGCAHSLQLHPRRT
jgi:hypothetical protein